MITNSYCSSCERISSLPIRSTWARAVLHKIDSDRCLAKLDHSQWYRLNNDTLIDDDYRTYFQHFNEDEQTKRFIQQCTDKSDNLPLQIIHSFLLSFLMLFVSRTSANGLLGRGQMFVFSTDQFRTLLDHQSSYSTLLDIGAADGSVTKQMSSLFNEIYVTELSMTMQWRLARLGYTVLDPNDWGDRKFDVITCLNVLDRCEKPMSLLKQIRNHLKARTSRLIISLVLPFKFYFEYNQNHLPKEFLSIQGHTPEEQINYLIRNLFEPTGFRLIKFTRLPYLSEGDIERSYYFLFDYIFVLEMS